MIATYRKILELLDRHERRRFYLLLVMTVAMGFVEAIGVASIMPFVTVLANPEVVQSNPRMARLYDYFGFGDPREFLMTLGLALLAVILLGLVCKAVTVFALTRFSYMRNYSIGRRLLAAYLRQPYTWFISQNSADLSRNVLSEVDKVVNGAIVPAMKALAHFAVVVFLVALVVLVDPLVALSAGGVLGGSYALIYLGARRYLTRIGRERIAANRERFRVAQEVFGGIKDVKIRGLEPVYYRRFRDAAERYSGREATNQIIAALPRFLLEGIAFGGMLGLMLILFAGSEGGMTAVLPQIGLYAFAGLRILPAMQQLYGAITQLRYSRPALLAMVDAHRRLQVREAGGTVVSVAERLRVREGIEIRDLAFTYPGASRPALREVNMVIPANTMVAFVGGSGAGKTTLADVILGLLRPERGAVLVDGVEIDDGKLRAWQRTIGYVPQHIFLIDDTIAANIAFGIPPEQRDQQAIERAARIAELHDFVMEQLPERYDTMVGERGVRLSGGQIQRIGIARALYHDPDVLLLDEATSALDNLTERAVMDAVHNLGRKKTMILIAHRLSTVQACDTIFVMQDGKVVDSGNYSELVAKNPLFRRMAQPAAR